MKRCKGFIMVDVLMGAMALLVLSSALVTVFRAGILPFQRHLKGLWNVSNQRYWHSTIAAQFYGASHLLECNGSEFLIRHHNQDVYTVQYYKKRLAIKRGKGRSYLSDTGDVMDFNVRCDGPLVYITATVFDTQVNWLFGAAYD